MDAFDEILQASAASAEKALENARENELEERWEDAYSYYDAARRDSETLGGADPRHLSALEGLHRTATARGDQAAAEVVAVQLAALTAGTAEPSAEAMIHKLLNSLKKKDPYSLIIIAGQYFIL